MSTRIAIAGHCMPGTIRCAAHKRGEYMRLQIWCLVFLGVLLAQAVRAQRVAEIPVNLTRTSEPIWHDYGYDVWTSGQKVHIPMQVPFFKTISIKTTVYVALDDVQACLLYTSPSPRDS